MGLFGRQILLLAFRSSSSLRPEKGQTLAEYALLLSFIVVLAAAGLSMVGTSLVSVLDKTSQAFSGAIVTTTTTPTTTTAPTTTTTTTAKKNKRKGG